MDLEVEFMFISPPKTKIDRNSTFVRNSPEYNRTVIPDLESKIDDVWEKRLKENRKLYNGTKFRLDAIELKNEQLFLDIGITCYKDFIGTNWSPESKLLQLKGENVYKNKQALMSDALGVGSLLLSVDNYVTFLKRSLECGEAVGLWDIPGGHAEPKEITGKLLMSEICIEELDPQKITGEIYDSVLREVIDEVNIPQRFLSDPVLLGICRNTTSAGRPSAEFLVRCALKSEEIRDLYLQGNQAEADESTSIQQLLLSQVLEMDTEHDMWKNMAPSSKGCISLAKNHIF